MVAKVAKKLGIMLVHISTDHLFDGLSSLVSEEEPINAINTYAITKAQAESAVNDVNPDVLIVRTNFYGWGTSYRKSFSDYIIESLRKKQLITLFDDVYYTPILMENLITTVHDLLNKKAKGIFNIVSDDRISKYEFGMLIAEEFCLDKSLIHKITLQNQTNLVRRPLDMSLSNRKVCKLLGRNMGSVKQDVSRLYQQEIEEKTNEIQIL
jgi:dTDP-4-dehydrorhamnose reductase